MDVARALSTVQKYLAKVSEQPDQQLQNVFVCQEKLRSQLAACREQNKSLLRTNDELQAQLDEEKSRSSSQIRTL